MIGEGGWVLSPGAEARRRQSLVRVVVAVAHRTTRLLHVTPPRFPSPFPAPLHVMPAPSQVPTTLPARPATPLPSTLPAHGPWLDHRSRSRPPELHAPRSTDTSGATY